MVTEAMKLKDTCSLEEKLGQTWIALLKCRDITLLTKVHIVKTMVFLWAFLVDQLVKNPLAMWETWVRSLGWEDPLEKGKATHSRILAWRIPWTVLVHGVTESDTTK